MKHTSLIAEFFYCPRSESQIWELLKAAGVWQEEPNSNRLRVTYQ